DGIRDFHVTGVQTCALPIFSCAMVGLAFPLFAQEQLAVFKDIVEHATTHNMGLKNAALETQKVGMEREAVKGKWLPSVSAHALRSEERRVGKEWRSGRRAQE